MQSNPQWVTSFTAVLDVIAKRKVSASARNRTASCLVCGQPVTVH